MSFKDFEPPKSPFTKRDLKGYSLIRAILSIDPQRDQVVDAGLEAEVTQELRKTQPGAGAPLIVPGEIFWYQLRGAHEVATASKGGELKFTEPAGFLESLRPLSVTGSLGATMVSGLVGDFKYPDQATETTVEWRQESPGSDQAESAMTFGARTMTPKQVSVTTSLSRKLAVQSQPLAEAILVREMGRAIMQELDRVAVNGSGASNQPLGIVNTSGIGSVAGGANGAEPTYNHLVEIEREVAIDDADRGRTGWAVHPKIRAKLRKKAAIDGTTGVPAWPVDGRPLGNPGLASTTVPENLTKGTSTTICSAIIFGNFEDLIIGAWGGGLDVIVDPYVGARRGDIRVTSILHCDVAVARPMSFAAMLDALVP